MNKIITMGYWHSDTALPTLIGNLGILWAAAKSGDYQLAHILAHLKDQRDEAFNHGVVVDGLSRGIARLEESLPAMGAMRVAGLIEGRILGTYKENNTTEKDK